MSSFDPENIPSNPSNNTTFNELVERVRSRRGFLKSGLGLGAVGFLGAGLTACGSDDDDTPSAPETPDTGAPGQPGVPPVDPAPVPMLGFKAIPASSGDTIVVPEGYRSAVLTRWGDPLFSNSPAWAGDASDTAAAQALQFGDNHDGMHFFPLSEDSSTEGLLVMNHEYINDEYFFTPGVTGATSLEATRKSQHAHGVSVAHVRLENGNWKVVVPSPYNRRIHANTPFLLTGPAAGHAMLQTAADPTRTISLGTINNCGNGYTMWGTYLTCEENFNGYFGTARETPRVDKRNAAQRRYGVSKDSTSNGWETQDARFDYVANPNEANRMGWIVEIDPFDPSSTPKKRTALGRFKHENAAQTLAKNNRVVVYMGDDQANDYIYKFVSDGIFDAATPMLNRNLLETGTLYVAQFDAGAATGDMMGTGKWIALRLDTATVDGRTLAATFADQGEILINARLAGDAVGATKMDRPEWVTVHPQTGEVYCTLTNNSGRTETDDANPRPANRYGQIVRWREAGNDAAAMTFEWDLFVLAGNAKAAEGLAAGSANITPDNLFNSPDGLAFDSRGRLWIQTDGSNANTGIYEGMGNNQMLVADPKAGPGNGEIRRFLVGPSGCEITGITFTPDLKFVFVNVQHPGEYGSHPRAAAAPGPDVDALAFSAWPERSGGRPRSGTVVIWKEDGGEVGT